MVVSERTLRQQAAEVKRRQDDKAAQVPLGEAVSRVRQLLEQA